MTLKTLPLLIVLEDGQAVGDRSRYHGLCHGFTRLRDKWAVVLMECVTICASMPIDRLSVCLISVWWRGAAAQSS